MDNPHSYTFNAKEDGYEESEAFPLQKFRQNEAKQFIEAQIQDGDTLQALALKFRCSVAELKRVNHMDKDNEIHARRTLKVPITPFSILTEAFVNARTSSPPVAFHSNLSSEIAAPVNTLVNTIHGLSSPSPVEAFQSRVPPKDNPEITVDVNNAIMNSILTTNPIAKLDDSSRENGELSDDMSSPLLECPSAQRPNTSTVEDMVIKEFTERGDNLGFNWKQLLLCTLPLVIIIPIVIIFFFTDLTKHHGPLHDH